MQCFVDNNNDKLQNVLLSLKTKISYFDLMANIGGIQYYFPF